MMFNILSYHSQKFNSYHQSFVLKKLYILH
nr:MAG TPA: hypothetical protein [Caudoviricetes sp.]